MIQRTSPHRASSPPVNLANLVIKSFRQRMPRTVRPPRAHTGAPTLTSRPSEKPSERSSTFRAVDHSSPSDARATRTRQPPRRRQSSLMMMTRTMTHSPPKMTQPTGSALRRSARSNARSSREGKPKQFAEGMQNRMLNNKQRRRRAPHNLNNVSKSSKPWSRLPRRRRERRKRS